MSDLSVEMMERVINGLWDKFEDKVVPKEANIVQKAEMRMAFVSGIFDGVRKYNEIHHLGRDNFEIATVVQVKKYTQSQAKEVYIKRGK